MTTVNETSNIPKTKKPSDSAFKQQRLPAWQPILTAGTVLPTFFVIGIAFIPVGIGLLYFSDEVKEYTVDYTLCTMKNGSKCADLIQANSSFVCKCDQNITLTEDFAGTVFMYYGLTNFYQNHRRYVKSRDDNQLLGRLEENTVSSDCAPFAYGPDENGTQRPVAPCGAIANSLFSDELKLFSHKHNKEVPLLRTGIAWPSDKKVKFHNPPGDLETVFKKYAKPRDWHKSIYQLDLEDPTNNGFQNEDLIVWMRTAALPTFRKLYRRIDHSQEGFQDGLLAGQYTLSINYTYPVTAFEGKKRMILSTTSLLGGKNPFLGIAYIVVGCICLVLGVVLLVIHIKCSKSNSELINVDQNTPYQ